MLIFKYFFLSVVCIGLANAQWSHQNTPTTNTLWSVCFVDTSNGWVAGEDGVILHTTNGGGNWNTQVSGTNNILYSVYFTNTNNGWIAGQNGLILHTTNGGSTWDPQVSGTNNDLWEVFFADSNNGWVVGLSGTIIHTTDGGNTWNFQSSGTSISLYSVYFIDSNNGWVVGGQPSLNLHTSDGGSSWILQLNGYSTWLYAIFFVDTSNGWLSGNDGKILHTTDGGNNWNEQISGFNGYLESIYFTDLNNGWIVGQSGAIIHTTDSGDTWESETSGTNHILYQVYFTDLCHGWAVGADGTILRRRCLVPVELTSFTATTQARQVDLKWTTATENNNLGFNIERKQLESEWETIGFKLGNGTTLEQKEYSFIDDITDINARLINYRLKQIDYDGSYEYSDEVIVDNPAPVDYNLQQNYPNPFNPVTTISYGLPVKSEVELVIYNALGEGVIQLTNEEKEAGRYSVEFNATELTSGIYFYRLQAGSFVETKKMVLMK